jgi:acylphosphatase
VSEIERVTKGFVINGRVQGVYYRAWTQATAEELGLEGTVRNRLDGSVEAHVSGDPGAVREFEKRLWIGPPASAVSGVEEVQPSNSIPEGPFRILSTF